MSLSEWVLLGLTAATAFVLMLLKQCRVLYFFVLCAFGSALLFASSFLRVVLWFREHYMFWQKDGLYQRKNRKPLMSTYH